MECVITYKNSQEYINRESLEIEIVYNDCYEREIYLVAKI